MQIPRLQPADSGSSPLSPAEALQAWWAPLKALAHHPSGIALQALEESLHGRFQVITRPCAADAN